MIYLILFSIVFFCIYKYDIYKKDNNKIYFFSYILLICICISALKFRVGSDILIYIEEYKSYPSLSNLTTYELFKDSNRQPGWIILIALLKSFSSSFILFQFVQAIFINTIIFSFIKTHTQYIFTAILFYLVYMYTELNFEVMRESFAVGFFILSINSFKKKKWWKYYIFACFALTFHLSAFFLFLIPFIRIVPINKFSLIVYYVSLSIIFIYLLPFLNDFFNNITFFGNIEEKATSYLNSSKYKIDFTLEFIIKSFILFSFTYYCTILYKYKTKEVWILQLVLLYFLFDVLNKGIPFFYRFNNYLIIFYIILLTNFTYSLSINSFFKRCRILVFTVLLILFCYLPIKSYFISSENNQVPVYRKYYPYYSIFSGKYDKIRETTFN